MRSKYVVFEGVSAPLEMYISPTKIAVVMVFTAEQEPWS